MGQELFVLVDLLTHDLDKLQHLRRPAWRHVLRQPADAHRVVGQPRAAHLLEQIENQLAFAERVEEHRHRADVHRVRADPQAVAGNPLQLAEDRPHVTGPARHLDREQLLHRLAVADVVGRGRDVVHPVGQQDDLRPVAVLAQLFDAAVQIADHHVAIDYFFAIEPQHDAQHTVGARVLRAHVDHELVRVEHRAVMNCRCLHDPHASVYVRRSSFTFVVRGSSFEPVEPFEPIEPFEPLTYSISACSRAWRSFNQSSGFSISSSPGPSSG